MNPVPRSFGSELWALLKLALPLIVLRVGNNLMSVVDTLVAGRISADSVAAIGLAAGAWFMIFFLPTGVLLGLEPILAQAAGGGEKERWERGLRTGRWMALAFSVPTMLAIWFSPSLLLLIGQPPDSVELLTPYLHVMLLGIPPALLFQVYGIYLTAHGHTRQFFVITIILNILNLILNLWFVRGGLGVPPLGVMGIGAATAGCSLMEWLLIVWITRRSGKLGHLHVPWGKPDASIVRKALRIGLPVGAQYGLEVWGFSATTFMMGLIGTSVLAGHHIAGNVGGLTFTLALGVSSAASALVGNAYGRRRLDEVRRSGQVGLFSGFMIGATTAVLMFLLRHHIVALYTDDPDAFSWGVAFLFVSSMYQFVDMGQVVGFGVLRGLGDTRVPMLFNVVAYWGIGLPLGAVAVFVFKLPPTWIWWGTCVSLTLVSTAILLRFRLLMRRLSSDPHFAVDPEYSGAGLAAPP